MSRNQKDVLLDSRSRWLLKGSQENGVEYLGLDSEGTGREKTNLLWAPAQLRLDDPEEDLHLSDGWTVFAPVNYDDPVIEDKWLAQIPDGMEINGRTLDRKLARPLDGSLDLAPWIGGTLPGIGAYIYIPFNLQQEEQIDFGFGADWWFQAWIDGKEVCSTFPKGNLTFPPSSTDFVRAVKLAKGSHLLVIRFIGGAASSQLCVSAKRKLWTRRWEISDARWLCTMQKAKDGGKMIWEVSKSGDDLNWSVSYHGKGSVDNARLVLPFNPMITPTVLLPSKSGDGGVSFAPWLMVAPDFGHLRIENEGKGSWQATMEGKRGTGCGVRHAEVTAPTEREAMSKEHVAKLGYFPQKLDLVFCLTSPLRDGEQAGLKLSPVELTRPEGIDEKLWRRIRRPYLNQWQPSSNWSPRKDEWMLLGNNALSDVAPVCAFYYGEPMLFWDEIVPGIRVSALLRSTVDHALHCHVARDGHCISFFDHEIHFAANPCFLIAAWQYWRVSGDRSWLDAHLPVLHLIGEFLARRDVDGDGLVESWNSGNAWNLRQPDRADVYFEYMNFGWKNAYTNAFIYKAWRSLAEMLEIAGKSGGAAYYRAKAEKLRLAYVQKFLSREHGWFVSWISQDGEVHDYCHTFVNGMAVAYGLVSPEEGREILERVIRQSHEIGFKQWPCGIPANLLPIRKADMMQPGITIDGKINNKSSDFWPDDLTEEAAFGNRYPNGVVSATLTWPYLQGLQTAGLDEEAERILQAMIGTAEKGLFQNGISPAGAEFFFFDGRTAGYEGYLPEVWNFLMAAFTKNPDMRRKLLGQS